MEKLDWLDELRELKWAVAAFAELGRPPGSYERENSQNIARGIQSRLDWCIQEAIAERKRLDPKNPC